MISGMRTLGVQRAAVRRGWGIGTSDLAALSKQEWKRLFSLEFRSQAERLCKGGKPLLLAREGERFSGVKDLGAKFAQRKIVVTELIKASTEFYNGVGSSLTA